MPPPLCVCVLLLLVPSVRGTTAGEPWPAPSSLPPHSWASVGDKVFIHGCHSAGLLGGRQLQLAKKFALLTVEKGQGEQEPGFAEDKMAALSAQWHRVRPDGWAIFCAWLLSLSLSPR
eukprot:COSAG01_NODE_3807_length_5677_cov_7.965041_3_plen_118_part_00